MSATKSDRRTGRALRRRELLLGGALGAAGLLATPSKSAAATDTAGWLFHQSSGPDAASVRYPAEWTVHLGPARTQTLDPYLLYPHQSFGLATADAALAYDLGPEGSGLPDLTGYPSNASMIWLMYYDHVVEGEAFAGLSLSGLEQRVPSEFPSFQSYLGRFSNETRSFLLWVWIGSHATQGTVGAVDASIQTITVP